MRNYKGPANVRTSMDCLRSFIERSRRSSRYNQSARHKGRALWYYLLVQVNQATPAHDDGPVYGYSAGTVVVKPVPTGVALLMIDEVRAPFRGPAE